MAVELIAVDVDLTQTMTPQRMPALPLFDKLEYLRQIHLQLV